MPPVALPVNEAILFNQKKWTSTNEKTSMSCLFRGTLGQVFYLYSDTEGNYALDIKIADTLWKQVAEGTVGTDELEIIDVKYFAKEMRVRFTPTSVPAVFTAEVFGYPSVFIRDTSGWINGIIDP